MTMTERGMTEANPCPTCGYQLDRVERINTENAHLRAQVVSLTKHRDGLLVIEQQKDAENERLRAALDLERECCARIAESFAGDYPAEVRHMAKRIAEVIRRKPQRVDEQGVAPSQSDAPNDSSC